MTERHDSITPKAGGPRRAGAIASLADVTPIPGAAAGGTIVLGPGDVDLWLCFQETLEGPEWREAFAAVLTPEERARHGRLASPEFKLEFLAAAALCRHALSRYAPVAPADWNFVPGEHGKPAIAAPQVDPPLWFNLSGTRGLVACAVSRATPTVGVDVERLEPAPDMLDVAAQFFSAREAEALRALGPEEQAERFFSLWTLKEAYVKARGLGIAAVPLQDFTFGLGAGAIDLSFEPGLRDDAAAWRFASIKVSADHLLAVGARIGGATPLRVRVATWIPE
jgi:4'-phosphopantetheinyl transferase